MCLYDYDWKGWFSSRIRVDVHSRESGIMMTIFPGKEERHTERLDVDTFSVVPFVSNRDVVCCCCCFSC